MLRSLKIVVVLLLVALIPARAIGAVTVSVCAPDQQPAEAGHHYSGGDMHSMHTGPDQNGDRTTGDAGHGCNNCAAHCAGVAFAMPTDLSRVAPAPGSDRIPFGSWSEPGFFPDHLDRPPLAS